MTLTMEALEQIGTEAIKFTNEHLIDPTPQDFLMIHNAMLRGATVVQECAVRKNLRASG